MTRRSVLARAAMTVVGIALAPSAATARSVEHHGPAARTWFFPLTPRQGKIAQLVARGLSSDIGVWVARQRVRTLLGIRA